jgi:hypothetical protein
MLTVAPPTCSSAAGHSAIATNAERAAAIRNVRDDLVGLDGGMTGFLLVRSDSRGR